MATPIPENRVPLTLSEVIEATGGEVRAGRHASSVGVTTDSRGDVAGKLFVALSGSASTATPSSPTSPVVVLTPFW